MLRERLDRIHLLPLAIVPTLQCGFEAARGHHEKHWPGAMFHIMRFDSVQGGEWHGLTSFCQDHHAMQLRTKLARSCAAENSRPTSLPHKIIRMPRPTYLRI